MKTIIYLHIIGLVIFASCQNHEMRQEETTRKQKLTIKFVEALGSDTNSVYYKEVWDFPLICTIHSLDLGIYQLASKPPYILDNIGYPEKFWVEKSTDRVFIERAYLYSGATLTDLPRLHWFYDYSNRIRTFEYFINESPILAQRIKEYMAVRDISLNQYFDTDRLESERNEYDYPYFRLLSFEEMDSILVSDKKSKYTRITNKEMLEKALQIVRKPQYRIRIEKINPDIEKIYFEQARKFLITRLPSNVNYLYLLEGSESPYAYIIVYELNKGFSDFQNTSINLDKYTIGYTANLDALQIMGIEHLKNNYPLLE